MNNYFTLYKAIKMYSGIARSSLR